jgi:hypothetical protein
MGTTDHTAYGKLNGKLLKIILTYELKMSTIVLVFAIISSEAKKIFTLTVQHRHC